MRPAPSRSCERGEYPRLRIFAKLDAKRIVKGGGYADSLLK
jgi:hypothetical protein